MMIFQPLSVISVVDNGLCDRDGPVGETDGYESSEQWQSLGLSHRLDESAFP